MLEILFFQGQDEQRVVNNR